MEKNIKRLSAYWVYANNHFKSREGSLIKTLLEKILIHYCEIYTIISAHSLDKNDDFIVDLFLQTVEIDKTVKELECENLIVDLFQLLNDLTSEVGSICQISNKSDGVAASAFSIYSYLTELRNYFLIEIKKNN